MADKDISISTNIPELIKELTRAGKEYNAFVREIKKDSKILEDKGTASTETMKTLKSVQTISNSIKTAIQNLKLSVGEKDVGKNADKIQAAIRSLATDVIKIIDVRNALYKELNLLLNSVDARAVPPELPLSVRNVFDIVTSSLKNQIRGVTSKSSKQMATGLAKTYASLEKYLVDSALDGIFKSTELVHQSGKMTPDELMNLIRARGGSRGKEQHRSYISGEYWSDMRDMIRAMYGYVNIGGTPITSFPSSVHHGLPESISKTRENYYEGVYGPLKGSEYDINKWLFGPQGPFLHLVPQEVHTPTGVDPAKLEAYQKQYKDYLSPKIKELSKTVAAQARDLYNAMLTMRVAADEITTLQTSGADKDTIDKATSNLISQVKSVNKLGQSFIKNREALFKEFDTAALMSNKPNILATVGVLRERLNTFWDDLQSAKNTGRPVPNISKSDYKDLLTKIKAFEAVVQSGGDIDTVLKSFDKLYIDTSDMVSRYPTSWKGKTISKTGLTSSMELLKPVEEALNQLGAYIKPSGLFEKLQLKYGAQASSKPDINRIITYTANSLGEMTKLNAGYDSIMELLKTSGYKNLTKSLYLKGIKGDMEEITKRLLSRTLPMAQTQLEGLSTGELGSVSSEFTMESATVRAQILHLKSLLSNIKNRIKDAKAVNKLLADGLTSDLDIEAYIHKSGRLEKALADFEGTSYALRPKSRKPKKIDEFLDIYTDKIKPTTNFGEYQKEKFQESISEIERTRLNYRKLIEQSSYAMPEAQKVNQAIKSQLAEIEERARLLHTSAHDILRVKQGTSIKASKAEVDRIFGDIKQGIIAVTEGYSNIVKQLRAAEQTIKAEVAQKNAARRSLFSGIGGVGGSGDGGKPFSSKDVMLQNEDYIRNIARNKIDMEKAYRNLYALTSRVEKNPKEYETLFGDIGVSHKDMVGALKDATILREKGVTVTKSQMTIDREVELMEKNILALLKSQEQYRAAQAKYKGKTDTLSVVMSKKLDDIITSGDRQLGTNVTLEQQFNKQWKEYQEAANNAKQTLNFIHDKQKELKSEKGFGLIKSEEYQVQMRMLDQWEKKTEQIARGFLKSQNPIRRLGDGLKGILATTIQLAEWQSIWYLSKSTMFAAPQIITLGLEYTKQIDEWNFKMLRWEATSGRVTQKVRDNVKEMITGMRDALLSIPASFEESAEAVQGFISAGVSTEDAKDMIDYVSILKSSFPEIDMERFGTAAVGAMNVFRDSIKGASTEAGKFEILLEMLLKAQAESVARPEHFTKILQYMSEIGKISGMSIEQLFSLSTSLADVGMSTSNASRLLRSFMIQVSRPVAQNAFRRLGVDIDGSATSMENLNKVMFKLREIGVGGKMPMKWMEYFQTFLPKEEVPLLIALADRWIQATVRTAAMEKSGGGFKALEEEKVKTIKGQIQLLWNTLKEIGTTGNLSAKVLGGMVAAGLDAARGALLALNPNVKNVAVGFEQLGEYGRRFYGIVKGIAETIYVMWTVIKPVVSAMGTIVEGLTRIPGLFNAIGFASVAAITLTIAKNLGLSIERAKTLALMPIPVFPTWIKGSASTSNTTSSSPLGNKEYGFVSTSSGGTTTWYLSKSTPVGGNVRGFIGSVGSTAMATGLIMGMTSGMWSEDNRQAVEVFSSVITSFGLLAVILKDISLGTLPSLITSLTSILFSGKGLLGITGPIGIALGTVGLAFLEFKNAMKDSDKMLGDFTLAIQKILRLPTEQKNIALITRAQILQRAIEHIQDVEQADKEANVGRETPGIRRDMWKTFSGLLKEDLKSIGLDPDKLVGDTLSVLRQKLNEASQGITEIPSYGDYSQGGPKLTEPPTNYAKQYGAERAGLVQQQLNDALTAYKNYYSTLKSLEDSHYNMGYISTEKYFEYERRRIEDRYVNEIDTENKLYEEKKIMLDQELADKINRVRESNTNQKSDADRNAEIMQIRLTHQKKLEVEEQIHQNKIKAIGNTFLTDKVKNWESYYKKLAELRDIDLAKEASTMQHKFDMTKAVADFNIEIRGTILDYLYDKLKIDSSSYYKSKNQYIEETSKNEIAAAQQAYDKWVHTNKAKLKEAEEVMHRLKSGSEVDPYGTITTISETEAANLLKQKQEEEEKLVKAKQDAELKSNKTKLEIYLKYIDNINTAFVKGGILGVMSKSIENYGVSLGTFATQLGNVFTNTFHNMETSLGNFFDYSSEGFMNFGNLATQVLHDVYMELLRTLLLKQIVGGITSGISSLLPSIGTPSTPSDFSSAFTNAGTTLLGGISLDSKIGTRAEGGSVKTGRMYWVGEKGPELFSPDSNGYIIPNSNIGSINTVPAAPPTLIVNVENKTGKQVRAIQSQPQFDGKRYIRTVMLELVDTDMTIRQRFGAR